MHWPHAAAPVKGVGERQVHPLLWCTLCAIISSTVLWSYEPVFNNERWGFTLMWDDGGNFVQNDMIKPPFSMGKLVSMFTETRINVYEPFSWICKAAVVHFLGMDRTPLGISCLAIFFHAFNSIMLMFISYHILAKARELQPDNCKSVSPGKSLLACCCCAAALLYSVHPVFAEVVSWASATPYAQATSWLLVGTYLWLQAHHALFQIPSAMGKDMSNAKGQKWRNKRLLCMAAAACYLGGVLSKAVALPWPIVPIVLDIILTTVPTSTTPSAAVAKSAARRYGALAAVGAAAALATALANRGGADPHADVVELPRLAQRAAKAQVTLALYLRLLLWPADLRPHRTVFAAELGGGGGGASSSGAAAGGPSPECALSRASLCALAVGVAARAAGGLRWGRAAGGGGGGGGGRRGGLLPVVAAPGCLAPAAALAVYAAFFLPTCGLVQHGMVQKGGDRYAYLPYQAFVPAVAHLLVRVVVGTGGGAAVAGGALSSPPAQNGGPVAEGAGVADQPKSHEAPGDSSNKPLSLDGIGHPAKLHGANSGSGEAPPSAGVGGGGGGGGGLRSPPCRRARPPLLALVWLCAVVGPVARCLAGLTRAQVGFWADDEALYTRSLALDPHDWRILDEYAELLHVNGRAEEAAAMIERANAALPRDTAKGFLSRAKNLVFLGDYGAACAAYRGALASWPASPELVANLAVCLMVDREFAAARAALGQARLLARTREQRAKIGGLLAKFGEWEARGFRGFYEGSIMW